MRLDLFRVAASVALILTLSVSLSAADLAGRVMFLEGDVTVNGKAVDTGDRLAGASLIRTGKASEIEVVFADQNVFRLGPSSVLKVDFQNERKTVVLDKGLFTAVLRKLAKVAGDPSFVLKTPTVVAGVRGTSFHVTTDGNTTYFCTCNGSVALTPDGSNQLLDLTNAHHGSRIFTREANGSISVVPGGLQDHTDATVESLAKLIGATLDWSKPDLSSHTP